MPLLPAPHPAKRGDIVIVEEPRTASNGHQYTVVTLGTVTQTSPDGSARRLRRAYSTGSEAITRDPAAKIYILVAECVDVQELLTTHPPTCLDTLDAARDHIRPHLRSGVRQSDIMQDRYQRLRRKLDPTYDFPRPGAVTC